MLYYGEKTCIKKCESLMSSRLFSSC